MVKEKLVFGYGEYEKKVVYKPIVLPNWVVVHLLSNQIVLMQPMLNC